MDLKERLETSPLFWDVDTRTLRDLAERARWLELPSGQQLYGIGDPGDAVFIVSNGRLRVTAPDAEGAERLMGEVGRGEAVGEISLITGGARTANVSAVRDSGLIRISKEDFEVLLKRHPQAMMKITRIIVERLRTEWRYNARDAVRSVRTIALLPAQPDLDIEDFAVRLSTALGKQSPSLRLDPYRVDNALGKGFADTRFDDQIRNHKLYGWLNGLEASYRYLIYQAGNDDGPWSRRCLRQADRIVLLVRADAEAERTAAVELMAQQDIHARIDVVILHSANEVGACDPIGWRRISGADFHHHVRHDKRGPDIERLARLISGQALCLILGGGGARGLSHLGLLRALAERDLPVDFAGGTSMGALIAAMVALEMSQEQMLSLVRETFVDNNYLNDYSASRISMINARKFRRRLEEIFGATDIEKLPIPYFCVTTNLTQGVSVAHTEGRLTDWVGTSMTVPGIAPPTVISGGDLLVDGGLTANLPVDIMLEYGRGNVLASDCGQETELRVRGFDAEEAESLVDLHGYDHGINMFKILYRAATMSSPEEREQRRSGADLLFKMPVAGVGMFDWDQIDRVVYQAYCYADEVLGSHDALLARRAPPQTVTASAQ